MENKIPLKHPEGKKGVNMDRTKYEILKKAIVDHLKSAGTSTYTDMLHVVTSQLRMNKINFQGSVAWHMEWVKLDLEARKEIKRIKSNAVTTYSLA